MLRKKGVQGIKVCFVETLLWYENYDMDSIVTPVKVRELERLLVETEYPREKTQFLVNGFTEGFTLGYEGPMVRRTFSRNHKLRAGNQTVLWNKIMLEVKVGRMTGPHLSPPYSSFIQSPITLIAKKGSESLDPIENTRLIFDLSSPRGESLNDYTPRSVKSVEYPLFDKSIRMCLKEGKSCFLSKTDCKSAFLMLPLAPDQFRWVVMMCEHPCTGQKYYFCLKTVCFGSGTSCFLYMKLSNALAHIFRRKSNGGDISNLLDDFLTCKRDEEGCNEYLRLFMNICEQINLPLSEEKTCYATQVIVFLGLLINTITQTISIPHDKIERGQRELDILIRSKKITVKQLQKLTGLLNFFCRAVVPGRAFTRRLYAKMKGLQKHHHLRVDKELKSDSRMWLQFLEMDQAVCRPFLDFDRIIHADEIEFFTDGALDDWRVGVGGCFGNHWFSKTIRTDLYAQTNLKLNIQIVELASILLGLSLWIEKLENKRVVIFCDNESVVFMINKSTSSCRVCMIMLRMITLWSMRFNCRVFCTHLSSEKNWRADKVGEYQFRMRYTVDFDKTSLSGELWPIPRKWLM